MSFSQTSENLADLVVLLYSIGLSLPILEDMAYRKAVITNGTLNLKEIVEFVELVPKKLVGSIHNFLAYDLIRKGMAQAYIKMQSLPWNIIDRK